MRALLLVHQGAPSTRMLVNLVRDRGFEPFVLSTAIPDDDGAFGALCAELGIAHRVSQGNELSADEVRRAARELTDGRFCLCVAEGLRTVMACANEELGARDVAPAAIARTLDKYRMRRTLVECGLSGIGTFRLDDPELRTRLDRGDRHIVKPRRGIGSLCTRAVTSLAEVTEQVAAFGRGPTRDDPLREYFHDNELIAETYFEGRELSWEMMRQAGRTVIAVEQERTAMEFTGHTVLERGYASPAITLSEDELAAARALTDRVLDELGLDTGPYHVELRIGPAGDCEIIEINPRGGGGFLVASVQLQLGRALGDDWISTLLDEPLPPPGARTCGTYCQNQWLVEDRQILGVRRNEEMTEPHAYAELFRIGARGRVDREEPGVRAMWRTELPDHAATVAALAAAEYVSLVYARGRSGAPLFLVLEPTNHLYQVIEAAARRGYDVIVFHTLPLPAAGPYAGGRDGIAEIHRVSSWNDIDACFAQVLAACGDAQVAGTYAGQEVTLELDARLQEHFGLPGKPAAIVRELLNKVTTRRRLADAGLTGLRVFEESEVEGWTEWPLPGRALYFKPVRGAASAFVRRCTTLADVRAAIDVWRAADKAALPVLGDHLTGEGGGFFLEQEARGELLSAEGYVYGGEYRLIGLLSRVVLAKDPAVEMGISYPFEHPRIAEIADVMSATHKALGVGYGLTHAELMVPDDGDIELVELNLRFAGADSLTTMNVAHGCRFEDELVALAVGEAPRFDRPLVGYTCLQELLAPVGANRLESVELPVSDLPFVKYLKAPGSDLVSTDQQIDWIVAFLVLAPTYREAFDRAQDIRRRTRINGVELGSDPNNVVYGH